MAEAVAPPPNCGIISIKTPSMSEATLRDGWAAILRLSFFDTDDDKGEDILPGTVFDPAGARAILDFVETNANLEELVIHCDLGISRSAAVAILLGEYLGVPVYRQGAPVDPRYRQHNAHVYRVLFNEVCRRADNREAPADNPEG